MVTELWQSPCFLPMKDVQWTYNMTKVILESISVICVTYSRKLGQTRKLEASENKQTRKRNQHKSVHTKLRNSLVLVVLWPWHQETPKKPKLLHATKHCLKKRTLHWPLLSHLIYLHNSKLQTEVANLVLPSQTWQFLVLRWEEAFHGMLE